MLTIIKIYIILILIHLFLFCGACKRQPEFRKNKDAFLICIFCSLFWPAMIISYIFEKSIKK